VVKSNVHDDRVETEVKQLLQVVEKQCLVVECVVQRMDPLQKLSEYCLVFHKRLSEFFLFGRYVIPILPETIKLLGRSVK
jgi:hypothetical protein